MGRPAKDLTGQKFQRWTVLERDSKIGPQKQIFWKCRCKCGTERVVAAGNLMSGQSKSCGCLTVESLKTRDHSERVNVNTFVDLTGKKVGRWTIISQGDKRGHEYFWWCRCECGTERFVNGGNLRKNYTQSCGCLQKEANTAHDINHFMIKHPIYRTWSSMKDRCLNPNNKDFHHYGGRGITVSNSWLDFKNFLCDMEPTWQKGLELDRIDVMGNYEKDNCRWATRKEQMNNTRAHIEITLSNGKVMNLRKLSQLTRVPLTVIISRYENGLRGNDLVIPPDEYSA